MYKKVGVVLFFIVSLVGFVYAKPGDPGNFYGNCEIYKVNVSKLEISQDNINWLTLGEGVQEFDIVSDSASQKVAAYINGKSLLPGTYKYLRVTLSRAVGVKGKATSYGKTYYTTSSTAIVEGGKLGEASDNQKDYALCSMLIPSGFPSPDPVQTLVSSGDNLIITDTLSDPFAVESKGGAIAITFDKPIKIEFDPDESTGKVTCWPFPPHLNIKHQ
jgi:hypothetical protein